MKCPNCQNEMKEGQLYCEKCGYEIQMVPDFEPEIDAHIVESMTSVVNELTPELSHGNSSFSDEDFFENADMEEELEDRPSLVIMLFHFLKRHVILTALIFAAMIVLIVLGSLRYVRYSQENSFDYQFQLSQLAADDGDYTGAISYLSKAFLLDSSRLDVRLLMGDYYLAMGDTANALIIYQELLSYSEFEQAAYERLISYYLSVEAYDRIQALLLSCENREVLNEYNEYRADAPIFSINSGTYDDAQILKLSANTNGIIYYTMDGSTPTEADIVYTGPVSLASGNYEISAIFINTYGVRSAVASGEFLIDAPIPLEPVITPTGGDYQLPEYITVEVPQGCTVYYTTDGSAPNQSSTLYSRSICMPLGETTFRMVTYSENQIASEVSQVEYHLYLDNPMFSEYQAMLITASGLTNQGFLKNMEGEKEGTLGTYSYQATAAFIFNEALYYLMTEYYTDTSGNTYTTQNRYAVGVNDGILYQTNIDAEGHYTAFVFE